MASINKTGTGVYEITLDNNGTPTGRSVVVTPLDRSSATVAIVATVTNPAANPIVVNIHSITDSGGGSVAVAMDDEDFTFAVFQDA